jgi:hypothetical protein
MGALPRKGKQASLEGSFSWKATQPHPLDVKGVMPMMLTLVLGAEEGMESDDLLCSRNARPQKALVGRAQWKINQPPSLARFGEVK